MSIQKIVNNLMAEIECSVCFETLQNPRLLPCGHRFCHPCLERLEQHENNTHVIKCPMCRKMTRKRTADLPSDILAKQICLKLEDLKNVLKCSVCVSHDSESRCFDCHTSMCKQCMTKHSSLYMEAAHGVVKNDSKTLFCSKHGADMNSICLDCYALVCNSCIIDKCFHHKRISVAKAIEQYFRTREEKLDLALYSRRHFDQLDEALLTVCGDAITQIEEHSHRLIDEINRETANLVAEVQKIKHEALNILSTTNEAAQYLDNFRDINETDRETGIPSILFKKLPFLMRKELEEAKQVFNISKMDFIKEDFPGIGTLELTVSRGTGNEAFDGIAGSNKILWDDLWLTPSTNSFSEPAPLIYGCQDVYCNSSHRLPQDDGREVNTIVIDLKGSRGRHHSVDKLFVSRAR